MNSENIKEINNLINSSIQDNKKYVLLNKRYQLIIGCFLLFLSLILIVLLVFYTHFLAIQQALIAVIGILIIAALETFKNLIKDEKKSFLIPSIKLDNRTFIYGDYNSRDKISNNISNRNKVAVESVAAVQKLLNQSSKAHPIQTTQEKMVIAAEVVEEIENSPSLKERVASALKTGGTEAFKEMLAHPAAAFVVAAMEGWQSEGTEAQEK